MNNSRVNNVIFPLWFVFFMPPFVFITLFGNLVIDGLVIYITLKVNKTTLPKQSFARLVLKAWGIGFLADALGAGVLLLSSVTLHINLFRFWDSWLELIILCISVIISGILIGLFDYQICRKANLSEADSRRVGVAMGILTSPWMFLIPTPWVS